MRNLTIIFSLALFVSPTAFADKIDDILKVWDANGDGVLTKDEIPDAGIFAKVDKNNDGKATREEVAAFLGLGKPEPRRKDAATKKKMKNKTEAAMKRPRTLKEWVDDFFLRYDKDKDKQVTKKEFPTGERIFEAYDKNKNDALSRREATRYVKADLRAKRMRPTPNNFFELFDLNRDKKVTRKEYSGPRDFFRRYDHDKNGAVTLEEINAGPDQGKQSMKVMKGDKKFMGDGPTEMPRRGLLERYDKNTDGRITLEELDGAESVLNRLDKNNDGVLSGSEVR